MKRCFVFEVNNFIPGYADVKLGILICIYKLFLYASLSRHFIIAIMSRPKLRGLVLVCGEGFTVMFFFLVLITFDII